MPEGDTVWWTARTLQRLSGQAVTESDFRIPSLATRDLSGRRVLETIPRGKHLLTRLDGEVTLHSHLRMEGAWHVHERGARWRRPAHTARVVLRTEALEAVGFQVVVDLVRTSAEDTVVGHLGPDLLGPDWDAEVALERLRADPSVPVGDALLDQRNLAGIGNVYKSELCFLARVDPVTPVGEVADLAAIVDNAGRLLEANKEHPQRSTTGVRRPGRRLWVYGRRGPCLRCGAAVRRADQGPGGQGRVTYWCPRCQPRP